ncbi:MAG: hypothetical protein J6X78_11835 [Treponema sp.]|nr:hypothetical protein [Treponema sp.]
MIFGKRLKSFLLVMIFCLCSSSLFAIEDYVSKVYKEIDVIFENQSDNELHNVLSEYVNDRYYYLMENYTKKKIRRLIIDNEYEFAMSAIYVIIDNNIDGDFEDEDAVDLYATVAEAYEIQKQYELEQEQKALAEAAKKEAEKERLAAEVDKDYNVVTTSEGKKIYLSAKDERQSSYRWSASFGMIDFGVSTAKGLKSPLMGEGISLEATYEYTIPQKLEIGGDLFFDFKFMQFNSGPMNFNFEIAPKVAFPKLNSKLFFRLGFCDFGVLKQETQTTAVVKEIQECLYGNVVSPFLGVQLSNENLGNAGLTVGLNYLFAGIISGDYQALSLNGGVSIPFAELERVKLLFNVSTRDILLIKKQGGVENHLSVILGFGVENVIR